MTGVCGSCLCQNVCYEISGPIIRLNLCHCTMCQKSHGAAFAPYLRVAKEDFSIVRGQEFVASFQSNQEITRTFCHVCGSNLQWIRASSDALGVAAGTLDSVIDMQPSAQYWCVDSKQWHQLREDVRRYDTD
ncbi:MAG TPA: GFA family protein [Pseudomonadales bacterium]|nr:GFA family protein [Pseudomonadales bacterium]